MTLDNFVDYYEILQLSPNAYQDTIERVFPILAKRYHPDNGRTGGGDRFRRLVEGHGVLLDPEKRASCDVRYDKARVRHWKIFDEASALDGVEIDRRVQRGITFDPLHGKRAGGPQSRGGDL